MYQSRVKATVNVKREGFMTVLEIVDVERLFKQQSRVRSIRNLQSDIDVISSKLSSPGSVKLTDMPKSQAPFDKLTMWVSKKIEKEKQLLKLTNEALEEGAILEEVINSISNLPESTQGASNSVYQDLLRYHFLNDISLKEILEFMGIEDDDLNYDSKLRLMYTRRFEALNKFIKCQKI